MKVRNKKKYIEGQAHLVSSQLVPKSTHTHFWSTPTGPLVNCVISVIIYSCIKRWVQECERSRALIILVSGFTCNE